jgi:hypothetical protein
MGILGVAVRIILKSKVYGLDYTGLGQNMMDIHDCEHRNELSAFMKVENISTKRPLIHI